MQIMFRLSTSWAHKHDKNFHVNFLGVNAVWYCKSKNFSIRFAFIGLVFTIMFVFQRVKIVPNPRKTNIKSQRPVSRPAPLVAKKGCQKPHGGGLERFIPSFAIT